MTYKTHPRIPASRTYIHLKCGTKTTLVDGPEPGLDENDIDLQPHTLLSNPLQGFSGRTACGHCGQMLSVEEFAWADTNETIHDFRTRWAARSPFWAKMICSPLGAIAIWGGSTIAGLTLGLLSSFVISSWWIVGPIAFIGTVVGFLVGMAILEPILAVVFRLAYKVEDPRQLI